MGTGVNAKIPRNQESIWSAVRQRSSQGVDQTRGSYEPHKRLTAFHEGVIACGA